MDDVILYADNKVVASYSTNAVDSFSEVVVNVPSSEPVMESLKERDISKPKYSNCPNCGAPVTGPICEYCGSVLDQAELDRQKQEQELAKKQRQYEEALRRWQQSVIQAELGQSIMDRMNYYGYSMSQCCCDTRTQMMQQSILQSQNYIQKPVPLVIEEKQTKDFGEDVFGIWVIIAIIVILLIAAPIAAFLA